MGRIVFAAFAASLSGCISTSNDGPRVDTGTATGTDAATADASTDTAMPIDSARDATPVDSRSDATEPDDAGPVTCFDDTTTGLCWQEPPSASPMGWSEAGTYCSRLGAGYRLPTIDELIGFTRGCANTTAGCEASDPTCLGLSCCDFAGCNDDAGPDDGCYWPAEASGTCDWYHSSSVVDGGPYDAWFIYFQDGSVQYGAQGIAKYVRCVRDS